MSVPSGSTYKVGAHVVINNPLPPPGDTDYCVNCGAWWYECEKNGECKAK